MKTLRARLAVVLCLAVSSLASVSWLIGSPEPPSTPEVKPEGASRRHHHPTPSRNLYAPALGGPYQAAVPAEVLLAYYPLDYREQILTSARETDLPAHLIAGIIRQESAFDPRATSPVGARGLMQLMPGTAREVSRKVGVAYRPERLYDPEVSVRLGSTYFRELLDRFDGNVELALAGYNGGPSRIRRLWRESGPDAQLDDFLETLYLDESRNYVKRILVLADSYRQLYPALG
jgi:soluble lytic murein transglycosylase-like protein